MNKNLKGFIAVTLSAVLLAACSEQGVSFGDKKQSSDVKTEQTSSSQAKESSQKVDTDKKQDTDQEKASQSDKASSQVKGKSVKANNESGQAGPGQSASKSQAEAAEKPASSVTPSNNSNDIIAKVVPMIHQVTDNIYRSEDYSFMPSKVDDNLVQVEIRRQSPNNQIHTNLVAIYRYNNQTGELTSMDLVSGQWQKVN
ncbi:MULTISPECIES: hypothetical protein [Aerococcus]|uniref:Uncharacterized protein n=2 Tax=Aerococcus TaxID=1375 RepID=A0A178HH80_9LACT|nr:MULTISPECIES: hypothetical protein [Aerococcus]KAA9221079.1 hypothetical protein F6I39_00035 [Aerococcus loyolae]KAA9264681.1 hypothetical protein F6I19_06760 [Aerococcus loyolae]MCY3026284.1 hypothetical protein [Aerococcus loyolae]MCY3026678.1 hypothetical protein [Aerococcus loyolae]MCY3029832.1 hypothetical protein [Aerococcus loyolae]